MMCQFELDIFPGTTERAVEFNSTLDRQGLRWHEMKVKVSLCIRQWQQDQYVWLV